jgi:hypothetical protein
MVNLAPIRYAKVLSRYGGPIERVECAPIQVLGKKCVQAVAFLRKDIIPEGARSKTLTEQPDGAGSHQITQIACHMAVSEALERWAVFHCRAYPESSKCGLEYDHSSNGFAAYPGLWGRQTRKAAFRESIERHCLICWWEGLLAHHPLPDLQPDIRVIQIENPFSRHAVVVMWGMDEGRHIFAFGAGEGRQTAVWRANVEMGRVRQVARDIDSQRSTHPERPLVDLFERRIHFFASEEGFSCFLDRLEQAKVKKAPKMKLLYDGLVPGPWDAYTSVWRTVIESPSERYLSDAADYFFW